MPPITMARPARRAIGTAMTSPAATKLILDSRTIASLLKTQLDLSTEQTFELLAAIREAGLIREVRPGEYELAHDLIAEYFRSGDTSGADAS
jgi:hypothetical protein